LFALLGWHWMYQPPFEFKSWKPEFLIRGAKPIFVAVRPITDFDSALGDKIVDALGVKESFYGDNADYEALICAPIFLPKTILVSLGLVGCLMVTGCSRLCSSFKMVVTGCVMTPTGTVTAFMAAT
jgi:hypothetical protein